MNSWREKLERWFCAVAFGEAGEHRTALELAGIDPGGLVQDEEPMKTFTVAFAAAAFAEADCPEMALEILRGKKRESTFLEAVGLAGVRVRWGLVPMEAGSFLEAVGLGGARTRMLTLSI